MKKVLTTVFAIVLIMGLSLTAFAGVTYSDAGNSAKLTAIETLGDANMTVVANKSMLVGDAASRSFTMKLDAQIVDEIVEGSTDDGTKDDTKGGTTSGDKDNPKTDDSMSGIVALSILSLVLAMVIGYCVFKKKSIKFISFIVVMCLASTLFINVQPSAAAADNKQLTVKEMFTQEILEHSVFDGIIEVVGGVVNEIKNDDQVVIGLEWVVDDPSLSTNKLEYRMKFNGNSVITDKNGISVSVTSFVFTGLDGAIKNASFDSTKDLVKLNLAPGFNLVSINHYLWLGNVDDSILLNEENFDFELNQSYAAEDYIADVLEANTGISYLKKDIEDFFVAPEASITLTEDRDYVLNIYYGEKSEIKFTISFENKFRLLPEYDESEVFQDWLANTNSKGEFSLFSETIKYSYLPKDEDGWYKTDKVIRVSTVSSKKYYAGQVVDIDFKEMCIDSISSAQWDTFGASTYGITVGLGFPHYRTYMYDGEYDLVFYSDKRNGPDQLFKPCPDEGAEYHDSWTTSFVDGVTVMPRGGIYADVSYMIVNEARLGGEHDD